MAQADPIAALVAYLRADSTLAALLGTVTATGVPATVPVFGGSVPRSLVAVMPRSMVILNAAGGGLMGLEGQTWGDRRVDVDCYGSTEHAAWDVYLEVERALEALSHEVHGDTLLKWAKASSRGFAAKDPDTDWDDVLSSWQVLAGKEAVA